MMTQILVQIRANKLIYQQKPRLKTALEMLRTSMGLEDSLNEVTYFNYYQFHVYNHVYFK